MSIRAHISETRLLYGIDITIADHRSDVIRILHLTDDGGMRWDEISRTEAAPAEVIEPTVRLPQEAGRALLDALMHHYQGAEDTRQIRRDYDAERKRVDEQAKVIGDIARTLAARQA